VCSELSHKLPKGWIEEKSLSPVSFTRIIGRVWRRLSGRLVGFRRGCLSNVPVVPSVPGPGDDGDDGDNEYRVIYDDKRSCPRSGPRRPRMCP